MGPGSFVGRQCFVITPIKILATEEHGTFFCTHIPYLYESAINSSHNRRSADRVISKTVNGFSHPCSYIHKHNKIITFYKPYRSSRENVGRLKESMEKLSILPVGHLTYWFLMAKRLLVTRRITLVTLLNVTLNLSATSRTLSWFAIHQI